MIKKPLCFIPPPPWFVPLSVSLPAERGSRDVEIPHEKLWKCLWRLQHELEQEAPEVSQDRCSHEFPTQFGTGKNSARLGTNLRFPLCFVFFEEQSSGNKTTLPFEIFPWLPPKEHEKILHCNWIFCSRNPSGWTEHWLSITFNHPIISQFLEN